MLEHVQRQPGHEFQGLLRHSEQQRLRLRMGLFVIRLSDVMLRRQTLFQLLGRVMRKSHMRVRILRGAVRAGFRLHLAVQRNAERNGVRLELRVLLDRLRRAMHRSKTLHRLLRGLVHRPGL
jgi:hypothetical protein